MEGDTKSPNQQSTFSVFNKVLSNLHSYWRGVEFDGNPVMIEQIKCGENNLKQDHLENVQKFFKALVRDLHNYSSLNKKFKDMFRHVDRHANELDFTWCKDHSCCGDWQFKTIFQCFKVPTPVLRTFYEDHFDTFL